MFNRGGQEVLQLGVELPFHLCTAQEAAASRDDAFEQAHHNSPGEAPRILAMALAGTSQSRVSRVSVARPCAVNR